MSMYRALKKRTRGMLPQSVRYGVAALAIFAAFKVVLAFPAFAQAPGTAQLLLSLAVLVAAWYGGLGPGLFAGAVILLVSWPAALTTPNLLRVFVFSVQSVICSVLMEFLHRSRKLAQREAKVRQASEEALKKSDVLLREQAEALSEGARRKDEFLAMLAHELRNPLAALSAALAISTRSRDADDLEWSRNSIQRNIKQLARLIDDLLDVSRVTRGKIELRKERFEASSVVDQAVDSVQYLLATKGHQVAVSVARGSLWVDADPTRLQQILSNLLTNAIQYSEEGSYVRLRAERRDGEVVFSVRDNGQGIRQDLLPHVFELFTQGDRSLARTEGGLGIGLTMVKALTEMHGGTVTASSAGLGKGSEFLVSFPSGEKKEIVAPPAPAASPDSRPRGNRVLVVDDNVDLSRAFTTLLTRFGYEACGVHDGESAIEAARSLRPDIVLLDLGLPGMDGYEVAWRLRHEEGFQDTTIIAMTGYGQEDGGQQSREGGFNHHLIKPVQIENLVALLEKPPRKRGDGKLKAESAGIRVEE
jgi:signal transduction histidine kinase/ActR/RegA family two-component response regulator